MIQDVACFSVFGLVLLSCYSCNCCNSVISSRIFLFSIRYIKPTTHSTCSTICDFFDYQHINNRYSKSKTKTTKSINPMACYWSGSYVDSCTVLIRTSNEYIVFSHQNYCRDCAAEDPKKLNNTFFNSLEFSIKRVKFDVCFTVNQKCKLFIFATMQSRPACDKTENMPIFIFLIFDFSNSKIIKNIYTSVAMRYNG